SPAIESANACDCKSQARAVQSLATSRERRGVPTAPVETRGRCGEPALDVRRGRRYRPASASHLIHGPGRRAMTVRVLAALPLLAFALGCVEESPRALLVRPDAGPLSTTSLRTAFSGPRIPEHHATARRVFAVGRKLVDANPQAGLRPLFIP